MIVDRSPTEPSAARKEFGREDAVQNESDLKRMTLDECAREPIHIPGAIQPHGALLAIRESDSTIVQVSANLEAVFGISPADALGQTAVTVFGAIAWERIRHGLDLVAPNHAAGSPRLPLRDGTTESGTTVVTATRSNTGHICVELEPAPEERSPLGTDIGASVTSSLLAQVQSMVGAVRSARTVLQLSQIAVGKLRNLTGHGRVLAYRFGADLHGEVIAESVVDGWEPYLGLHYPASDIPEQARRMYLAQRVRVIADTDYVPVPMLAAAEGTEPLDMTFCALRSVSPIHIEYLRNMGVRSSIVVSLINESGQLWGMLVCHDDGPHLVSAELRSMIDLFGQVLSVLLASIAETEAITARVAREQHLRAIAASVSNLDQPIAEALSGVADDFLAATASTGAVARIDGRLYEFGATPPDAVAVATLAAFQYQANIGAASIDELSRAVPLATTHGRTAAGALVLHLPHGMDDAVAWFRPERATSVRWGGDPKHQPTRNPDTGRLSPRRSFAAWTEEVRGRSAAWTGTDLEAAADIRRILGDAFIRRVEAEMAVMRERDPLTGLVNRRMLQQRLDLIEPGPAHLGAVVVYIDLDRFKDINDTLGHAAGDSLLAEFGARLARDRYPQQLVARIGGDEFAILFENISAEQGEALAESICRAMAIPVNLTGRIYHATASVGIAHSDRTERRGGAALLQAADAAMYAAKRDGGNRTARYSEPLMDAAAKRFALEQDLRIALLAGGLGLSLAFQPIVQVGTGALLGLEALARWDHPDRGPISPGEFVPLAEGAGLKVALGDWVIATGLDAIARWTAPRRLAGLPLDTIPFLTINASPRQLSVGGFAVRIAAALASRQLPAALLQIEVTEGAMADRRAVSELHALRKIGVRVKIDDFGTGYSSLSYLRRLPADGVKLDRSFLPGVPKPDDVGAATPPADAAPAAAAEDEAFMTIIVLLTELAGLETVAEGIETVEQLAVATRAGVDGVQGYLLARPMPADDAAALVARVETHDPTPWADLMRVAARNSSNA
jgi:diguanylate cyclase (GGDEF)-like protein